MELVTPERSLEEVPSIGYDRFVRRGQVDSTVYTDPAIFEDELKKIFYRKWVYVGHESEIPNEGDFRLRKIGRKSLIFVRGTGGQVNVMFNRCRHRGATLCSAEEGTEAKLRCWYHGWTYDVDGNLVEPPMADAYDENFSKGNYSLTRPAGVDSYRGFYFAKFSEEGPSLREHLGLATDLIDLMIDASPVGSITVSKAVQRTSYRGNWKFIGMDGYHGPFLHASAFEIFRKEPTSGLATTHDAKQFAKQAPAYSRSLGNGHTMLDHRAHRLAFPDKYLAMLSSKPGGADYISAMQHKYGDRANLLITSAGDPHMTLFPNVHLLGAQIRVIVPIAVDLTEVHSFPVMLDGASDEINVERLRSHEGFNGPCGYGSPDDAEIFERMQIGLQNDADPWVDVSRGLHREQIDEDGSLFGHITDEVPQRAQMQAWLEAMNHD